MALLRVVIPYQWRAFWRGVRARGAWGGTNLSLVLVLALWLLPGHFVAAFLAAARMRTDAAGSGALLAEITLTSLLIAWLMTPILITGLQAHGEGVTPWRLAQFPLRWRELLLVGISGSLVHPGYWILVLASIAGLVPIAFAPHPLAGLLAGALFFLGAASLSWALGLFGSVLFSSSRAREVAILAITLVAVSLVFGAGMRTEHHASGLYLAAWGHRWLLTDGTRTHGLVPAIRDHTPGAWVVAAAMARKTPLFFALLLATFAASWALAWWSLRCLVMNPVTGLAGGRRQLATIGPLPFLPGALGGISLGVAAAKELRYLLRTMDTLLGIALGLGGAVYLVIAADASRMVLFLGIPIILTMEMAIPMNAFGLDRLGVDRYRLFPVSGHLVVLSKNLAFFLVALAQVSLFIVAAAFRFGSLTAIAALLGTGSTALLMAAWGNLVSVRAPAPRAFYNFDSVEQAGGVTSIFYCVLVWLAPGLVAVLTAARGDGWLVAGQLAVFIASAVIYRRLLRTAGALFDRGADQMRRRLAG